MNRQEAAWLLATLAAPYPGEPFTDDAAEVWYNSTLHNRDIDEAMTIVERLIASKEFRPTPAVFNEELRTARQHQAIAAAAVPALDAPRTSTHPAAEVIEELRRTLADTSKRNHWHGGPKPCPVCGGMQIPKKKARA
jgi:hypothetical protein